MIGLTSPEEFNSILNITKKIVNSNCIDTFDEFSFEELRDELEEILETSNITSELLQNEIIGPRIIQRIKNQKQKTDSLMVIT